MTNKWLFDYILNMLINSSYEHDNGCWIAYDHLRHVHTGYSVCVNIKLNDVSHNKTYHRWAAMLDMQAHKVIVPPPKGTVASHLCDCGHEGCINPYHIVLTTNQENCRRAGYLAKNRVYAAHENNLEIGLVNYDDAPPDFRTKMCVVDYDCH